MKKLVFLTIFLLSILPLEAQIDVVRWRNFSTDDGLPDNSVRSIFQDSDGLLWLCTREGICMYDGLHFKQLEDPSCVLLDGLAMSMAEDPQHRLWFITTRGIGFYDLGTGEIRTVRVNTSGGLIGAADIAVDRNGMVWFANEDIFCWDPSREVLVDYSPIALFHSNTVEADSNGTVWFLATDGDLYRVAVEQGDGGVVHEGLACGIPAENVLVREPDHPVAVHGDVGRADEAAGGVAVYGAGFPGREVVEADAVRGDEPEPVLRVLGEAHRQAAQDVAGRVLQLLEMQAVVHTDSFART